MFGSFLNTYILLESVKHDIARIVDLCILEIIVSLISLFSSVMARFGLSILRDIYIFADQHHEISFGRVFQGFFKWKYSELGHSVQLLHGCIWNLTSTEAFCVYRIILSVKQLKDSDILNLCHPEILWAEWSSESSIGLSVILIEYPCCSILFFHVEINPFNRKQRLNLSLKLMMIIDIKTSEGIIAC